VLFQDQFIDAGAIAVLAHVALIVVIGIRVIMLRPAPGVATAWLLLVGAIPLVGVVLYLTFGERRIGMRRAKRLADLRKDIDELAQVHLTPEMTAVDWEALHRSCRRIDRLGRTSVGVPTLNGSTLELFSVTGEMLDAIAVDVDHAQHSIHMEFYIWWEGGRADKVVEALVRAAKRGVTCRVLVDALGGGKWLRGRLPRRMREAGVEVRAALPVGPLGGLISRKDLRLHRKIVAIDGAIAWTGSMNLVDPGYFGQEADVGEWIDAMVRVRGNAVLPLAATVVADWQLESGEPLHDLIESARLGQVRPEGDADTQLIPSGPVESGDGILQVLLALFYAAEEELVVTTPYFVPDAAMLHALRGAAALGVTVHLIVPEKNNWRMVHHASRSYYQELMEAGAHVHLFRGGLLHTKSVTIDGEFCMIGTVNLDMRSIWLNYEVSLLVYDRDFTTRLRQLQARYMADSVEVDPEVWKDRGFGERLADNAFRLVSPLL